MPIFQIEFSFETELFSERIRRNSKWRDNGGTDASLRHAAPRRADHKLPFATFPVSERIEYFLDACPTEYNKDVYKAVHQ